MKELIDLTNKLRALDVNFISLQEGFDTSTSGGKLIFHVFGALAEFEKSIISDRTKAGLAAARARGRTGGRPTVFDEMMLKNIKFYSGKKEFSITEICTTLRISKATYYKGLKKLAA